MKFREVESVNDFITTSFANERTIRELRLTDDELALVKETYPYAQINKISPKHQSKKKWYEINIKPPLKNKELLKL